MELLIKAQILCRQAHQGQVRKFTGEPYHTHPEAVAFIVAEAGGTEEMIAAAFLHDVVEDTEYTLEHIRDVFGDGVADLVFWLTDEKGEGNRASRKAQVCAKYAKAPPEAQTIKLADIIHNTPSMKDYGGGFAKIWLAEKVSLLKNLQDGDERLYKECLANL